MSNNFDIDLITHLSKLSCIELDNFEKEKLTKELNTIISAVEKVSELELNDVIVSNNPIRLSNILRDDIPKKSISVEDALKNAPDSENDQFKVPKILDDNVDE
jgi:aspartyl-tRNA(Asn)/glutamyl-tRNA(Gln) amidotransferase subunit C